MLKENKKGSIQDIMLTIVVVLVMSILLIIGFKITAELNARFQESDLIDVQGKTAFQQITNTFPGVLDNSFLFIMFGLTVLAFILVALIRVHPIFLVPFIFVWMIVLLLSGVFSNVYQNIAGDPNFAAQADQLVFTSIIMQTLPMIIAIIGGVMAILMYKNWQAVQQ